MRSLRRPSGGGFYLLAVDIRGAYLNRYGRGGVFETYGEAQPMP